MQVVYPVCCGIDVHKTFPVATIIKTSQDGLTPTYSKKRFSTFTRELRTLKQWLLDNGCKDVCIATLDYEISRLVIPYDTPLSLIQRFCGHPFHSDCVNPP